MEKEEIRKVMSYLGKLSVKKQKKTKKMYREMARKRWANHKKLNKKK